MYYVCILTSNSCRHGSKQNAASLQCGFEKCGNNPWNFVSVFSGYFVYGCRVSTATQLHCYTPLHPTRVPAHLVEDVSVDLPRHLLAPQPGLLLLLVLLLVGRGLVGAEHCDQSVEYLQVSTISRQCDVSTVVSTLSRHSVVL